MNDSNPAIESLLAERFAAMTGAERMLMALQMFETAQQIVLSSLDPDLSEAGRRRELVRRFYGDELAGQVFPQQAQERDSPKADEARRDAPVGTG